MRIMALLLALLISHVTVVGQVVTFNYIKAPLETVLSDVTRQTGFSFHYQGQNLTDGTINFSNAKPVTLTVNGVEISTALKYVFDNQPHYKFSLEKEIRKVFISNKSETENIAASPFFTIRGRVSDEQGKPLDGVTILVKGSTATTSTDSSGFFNLAGITADDSLMISHVSYASTVEKVKLRRLMEIQLFPTSSDLDEVIVSVTTGYQKIPEQKMTGSFSYIDSQQFNRRISTNFLDRISNMAPGVLFNRNPGTGSAVGEQVVVRGISTIFGAKHPLIVVDNFPYDGDPNNINPNDVESITILKDAVASGLWSAFAGNGVIIVNTRKGKFDQTPRVSLVSNVTFSARPDLFYLPLMGSADYMEVTKFLYENGYYNTRIATPHALVPPDVMILDSLKNSLLTAGEAASKLGSLGNNDLRADLSKYLYRRSANQQYALNINGGGNKIRYYFSAGYDKNQMNLTRNYYERITLNANNTYLLLKDKLELTAGVAFAQSTTANNNNPIIKDAQPYTRLVDENGNPAVVQADYRQGYKNTAGDGKLLNWNYVPLEELALSDNQTKLTDYRVNLGAEYKLDFLLRGLKLIGRYQFGRGVSDQEDYRNENMYFTRHLINNYSQISPGGTVTRPIPPGGILDQNAYDYTSHIARLQVDYNTVWKTIHNFSMLAGVERRSLETQRDLIRYYGYDRNSPIRPDVDYTTLFPLFPTPFQPQKIDNPAFSLGTTDHYLSYYTNLMYTLKFRYNFSFNLRKDESNLFGKTINQRGTPLWSVGAGWLISREKFYHIGWLSELRARATYGYTGNIDKTISPHTIVKYGTTFNSYNVLQAFVENPANRQLQWEKVRITNFALDFALKNYVLSGSIEFYLKDTRDLIGFRPVDQTTGISRFKGNTASMSGKGFDVTLNARFIDRKNWKWYGTLLYSYASNRVTSYDDSGKTVENYVTQYLENPLTGTPLESIYATRWAGLNPENGNPRGYLGKNVTEEYDEIFASTDRNDIIYVGSSTPKFFGSYRNTISYKNFDLSFLIQYKLGYYFRRPSINYSQLYLGSDMGHTDYARRWKEAGDEATTNVPSMPYPYDIFRDNLYLFSDVLVEKADHIRLQDIQLGYTINKKQFKRLPFQSITLNAYFNNIGIIWKATDTDLDPEFLKDIYRAPLTSALGLQVNF
jgi:TonB-linked SusC/RagA family outer membrane protein